MWADVGEITIYYQLSIPVLTNTYQNVVGRVAMSLIWPQVVWAKWLLCKNCMTGVAATQHGPGETTKHYLDHNGISMKC